jgi:hypothetical protein
VSAQPSEHRTSRRPRLFRRRLLGYDPRAVEEALGARDVAIESRDAALREAGERAEGRIQELERVSARLATMVVDRDKEIRRIRVELQAALERDDGGWALAALADDLEMVRRQARTQATRMRLRALREAADVARRLADVERAGGDASGALIGRLEEAIERVGVEADWEEDLATQAEANGHAEREAGELFDGLVEVEVGPLSDFSQLVGFEDAAGEIGASSEISVRRFKQGRATLAMRFKHPVELLRELEERAPFEFKVRDMRSNRIVLDLDE